MRQQGKFIIGDVIRVESFTRDWNQVRLHPSTFYRRLDSFEEGFEKMKGLYTHLDLGQFISVRFANKEDLTTFHRLHHEYL